SAGLAHGVSGRRSELARGVSDIEPRPTLTFAQFDLDRVDALAVQAGLAGNRIASESRFQCQSAADCPADGDNGNGQGLEKASSGVAQRGANVVAALPICLSQC